MVLARQASRQGNGRAQRAQTISIPAPVGGLNSRDPLPTMEPQYGLVMTNAFPNATGVSARRGFIKHRTGFGSPIRTLMSYADITGSQKLFAVAGGNIYDATTGGGGAIGAPVVSGLLNSDFQYVGFTNPAASYLVAVNGQDTPRIYDGTTWALATITPLGQPNPPPATAFIGVTVHKNRLWFIAENHLSAWYLATDAISGNAAKFVLSSVFQKGSKLAAIGTFSSSSSQTLDDYLAFVSDQGEVVLYQGTDPSSAATWGLVQRFEIARPIGRRCLAKINNDLVVLTRNGVISISGAVQYDRSKQDDAAITSLIRRDVSSAAGSYADNYGWELFTYPQGRWFILNIPTLSNSRAIQYVQNTVTGAWGKFTGMNATTWALLNSQPYFGGGDATVYQADTGYIDDQSSYTVDIKTAFNYLGAPGRLKRITAIRPLFKSDQVPAYGLKINFDFNDTGSSPASVMTSNTALVWGVGRWGINTWGGVSARVIPTGISGIGTAVATRLTAIISGQQLELLSYDMLAEAGAFL